jgi:hypothetical protein
MDVILYQGEGVSRSPKLYSKPFPIKESMWKLPGDRNVWSQFRCKNFTCLASNNTFERDSSNRSATEHGYCSKKFHGRVTNLNIHALQFLFFRIKKQDRIKFLNLHKHITVLFFPSLFALITTHQIPTAIPNHESKTVFFILWTRDSHWSI